MTEALLYDLSSWIVAKGIRDKFLQNAVPENQVVNLLLHLLDENDAPRKRRKQLQASINTLLGKKLISCTVTELAGVLNNHLGLDQPITENHMAQLYDIVTGPAASSKKKSPLPITDHGENTDTSQLVILEYGRQSRDELAIVAYKERRTADKLRRKCKALLRQNAALGKALAKTESRLENQLIAYTELEDKVNFRKGTRNISKYGGYQIALSQQSGLASQATALAMLASQKHQGGFRSKVIVSRFEHQAGIAQKLNEAEQFNELKSLARTMVHEERLPSMIVSFSGDATNQDAIEKHKLYLGHCSCLVADPIIGSDAGYCRALCDMQIVKKGNSAETYTFYSRQLRSCGCPTWIDEPYPC